MATDKPVSRSRPAPAPPTEGGQGDSGAEKPKKFGKYDIMRLLGQGGMGKVFLGVDRDLKRTVAIKFLSKQKAENPVLVKRFKAEGQAAANLNHENVVRVFDSGELNGQLFLALEYVEGKDAHQMLTSRGRFPVSRSTEIVTKVARALEHAAKHGIVHRDIKPSNILIRNDGEIKLADMGLARSLDEDEDAGITRAGTTVGTVDYMSPEQARDSKAADLRSDIYSLGATWYQLLTGQPPFPDGDLTNKLRAHATARRPDPADLNDQIPESISAVINRMMAIKQEDRYQTVEELVSDLEAIKNNRSLVLDAVLGDSFAPGDIPDVPLEVIDEDEDDASSSRPLSAKERKRRDKEERAKGRRKSKSGSAAAAEDVDEIEDDRPKRKRRAAEDGDSTSSSRGRRARRTESLEDSRDDDDYQPIKAGRKPHSSDDDESPGRSGRKSRKGKRDEDSSQSPAQSTSKKRALPPREGSDEILESRKLDPDLIRNIAVGCVVLSLFGGIVWFISSQSGGSTPGPDTLVGNPYAVDEAGRPKFANAVQNDEGEQADGAGEIEPDDGPPNAPPGSTPPGTIKGGLSAEQLKAIAELPKLAPRSGLTVPKWVNPARLPLSDSSNLVEVRRDAREKSQFRSLQSALDSLPSSGGRIVLHERGPHRVTRVEMRNRTSVSIEAAPDGTRPVVEIVAGDSSAPVLDLGHTDLRLNGIDLFLRSTARLSEPRVWFGLDASALTVLDCSITDVSNEDHSIVFGLTAGRVPTAVFRPNPGRTLLVDTTVRGQSTSIIRAATSVCDVVVGNCYLDSGDRPVVEYQSAAPFTTRRPTNAAKQERTVLLAGTTAFSKASLFELTKDGESPIAQLGLRCEQSLAASYGDTPSAALVRLNEWPAKDDRPLHVTMSLKSSTFANWPLLARWNRGDASSDAGDTTGWRELFPQTALRANQLSKATLEPPPLGELPEDVASLPNRWRDQISQRVGAELLQADLNRTAWPEEGFTDRFRTIAVWSRPADLRAPVFEAKGDAVQFDLKKSRLLGPFLEGKSVPDGSVVRITGEGRVDLKDINLGSKRIRLECDQTAGGITLRVATNQRSPKPAFTIEGGALELVNALIELPGGSRDVAPPMLIDLAGGTLALRRTRFVDAAPDRPPTSMIRATKEGARVIATDSLLAGPGALLDGDVAAELLAENCGIFVGDTVIRGKSTSLLSHCSVRSGGTVIDAGSSTDVRAWIERSVIAPARSVVAANDAAVLRAIDWYGFENTFANGTVTTARGDTTGAPLSEEVWTRTWPAGHVAGVQVGGVGELGVGTATQDLGREDLELGTAGSKANALADGAPPGANPDSVGPEITDASKQKPKGPTRPKGPLLPF